MLTVGTETGPPAPKLGNVTTRPKDLDQLSWLVNIPKFLTLSRDIEKNVTISTWCKLCYSIDNAVKQFYINFVACKNRADSDECICFYVFAVVSDICLHIFFFPH
jgi:hypothetical protein